jgi:hypothetical protein
MHRCADVFRRNENVGLARLFQSEKTVARWMKRQLPGYQVGLSREDVSILPDARDRSRTLEFTQRFAHGISLRAGRAKFSSDIGSVQRPVIFPS